MRYFLNWYGLSKNNQNVFSVLIHRLPGTMGKRLLQQYNVQNSCGETDVCRGLVRHWCNAPLAPVLLGKVVKGGMFYYEEIPPQLHSGSLL